MDSEVAKSSGEISSVENQINKEEIKSSMRLFDLPTNEMDSIKYFQGWGILPSVRKCKSMHEMKLYFSGKQGRWRCNICRQDTGIRVGTFFEISRISFTNALRFIYLWSQELTSIKFCQKELQLSNETIVHWNNFLREICTEEMNQSVGKIGGPGLNVEVDESLICKEQSKRGRIIPSQCVIGGICRETKEIFMVAVPTKNSDNLVLAFIDHIHHGSIIHCDCLRTYKAEELEKAGLSELKDNLRYHFTDSKNGGHTQTITRLWGSFKTRHVKQRGTARQQFSSYMSEFIWRQNKKANGKDCFESILQGIAKQYPPEIIKT